MKRILFIVCSVLLWAGCQQEESPMESGTGYLVVGSLSATSMTEQVNTRAVAEDLYIKIDDTEYEPGQVPPRINLEAGTHTLEAYNEAYKSSTSNTPKYNLTQEISIAANRVTYLDLEVPMVNVGVSLAPFSEELAAIFTDPELTVTVGQTQHTVQPGGTIYFDYTESMNFTYALSATNADGEQFTTAAKEYTAAEAGHCYVVTYTLDAATKTLWAELLFNQ